MSLPWKSSWVLSWSQIFMILARETYFLSPHLRMSSVCVEIGKAFVNTFLLCCLIQAFRFSAFSTLFVIISSVNAGMIFTRFHNMAGWKGFEACCPGTSMSATPRIWPPSVSGSWTSWWAWASSPSAGPGSSFIQSLVITPLCRNVTCFLYSF